MTNNENQYVDEQYAQNFVIRMPIVEHPQRMVPLEKGVNFRDIGGYPTADGRQISWGKVYRSGYLARLTQKDLDQLRKLNIRLVYDLRSVEEVAAHPHKLPAGADIVSINRPIKDPSRISRIRTYGDLLFGRKTATQLMLEGYTRITLEKNGPILGEFLRRVAEGEGPAVVNCTAGKDRTGLTIALLLSVLGVPEDVIVADYAYSNLFYKKFEAGLLADPRMARLKWFGVTLDDIRPMLTAEPDRLRHSLDYLRTQYGSIDAYLKQKANVDERVMDALREKLLERSDA